MIIQNLPQVAVVCTLYLARPHIWPNIFLKSIVKSIIVFLKLILVIGFVWYFFLKNVLPNFSHFIFFYFLDDFNKIFLKKFALNIWLKSSIYSIVIWSQMWTKMIVQLFVKWICLLSTYYVLMRLGHFKRRKLWIMISKSMYTKNNSPSTSTYKCFFKNKIFL